MKKTILAIIMLTTVLGTISAQQIKKPFFGKVKDVETESSTVPNQRSITLNKVTPIDSTFMNLRPVTGVAYSFPNNQAQVYAGISYGSTTYNYKSKTTYINWSIDLVYSQGKTTTLKEVESDGSSFGVGGFVLNRNVGVLLLWNKYKKVDPTQPDKPLTWQPTVAVSWGINL